MHKTKIHKHTRGQFSEPSMAVLETVLLVSLTGLSGGTSLHCRCRFMVPAELISMIETDPKRVKKLEIPDYKGRWKGDFKTHHKTPRKIFLDFSVCGTYSPPHPPWAMLLSFLLGGVSGPTLDGAMYSTLSHPQTA